MSKVHLIAVALLAATSTAALAEGPSGFYAGAGVGLGQLRQGGDDCDALRELGATVTNCSDKATAARGFLGYQFNSYIGAELGYTYFGQYQLDASAGTVTAHADVDGSAVDLSALLRVPLGEQFSIFARGGVAYARADGSAHAVNLANGRTASASASSTNVVPTFGAGVSWMPYRGEFWGAGLRAEWQRFQDVGDKDTIGKSDVDLFMLSLVIQQTPRR